MDYTKYLSIPFVPNGRTMDGCDCYGLVRLLLTDLYGKLLPLFANDETEYAPLINSGLATIGATGIPKPEEGALVILRYLGLPVHIGLCIDGTRVIHTEKFKGVHIEALSSRHIASRIVGFYRVH